MRFSAISSFLLAYPSIIFAAAVRPGNIDSRSSPSRDVDVAPSVYVHPSFVADRDHQGLPGHSHDNDTPDTSDVPSSDHFEMPFNASSRSEELCGHNLTIPYSGKNTKVNDCLDAMDMLLSMKGHWDTSGWKHAAYWHRFFGYGTCNVWLKSNDAHFARDDYGNEIKIGNLDIYSRIREMVEHHVDNWEGVNVTGGMGNLWCLEAKDVKVNWSINHS